MDSRETEPTLAQRELGLDTLLAHACEDPSRFLGAVSPPLFQASLFAFESIEDWGDNPGAYRYTRVGNPTTEILERKLALLERGECARMFGSGMGAITAAIMSCTRAGDHVVAVDGCYARALLDGILARFGVATTYVNGTDTSAFDAATRPNTTLYYIESPLTVVFDLQDIAAVCSIARSHGVTTLIDNSHCTPYYQNPIEMGVDIVVHSASKYLGGHSDLIGGALITSEARLREALSHESTLLGAVMDPFVSWLILRGMRTLAVRLERHQRNATAVASWLEQHPAVERVIYTGLPSHPQYGLAKRQQRGSTGLLTFIPKESRDDKVRAFANRLELFRLAVSWGGYESLAAPIPRPLEGKSGHSTWRVRLHVGLEDPEDLIADLDQALRVLG